VRICFINLPIEFYSPTSGGAIATIIYNTAQALLRAGHDVTILTPVNNDPTYGAGTVIPVDARQRNELSFLQRRFSDLKRIVAKYDWPYYEYYLESVLSTLRSIVPTPDVVIAFNDLYLPSRLRAVLPDARIAVWLQNECRTSGNNLVKTRDCTDIFLTCSRYIADWTESNLHICSSKIHTVLNGVDDRFFSPRPDYLLPPAVPQVLFLGRIDRNKGPDLVVAAVAALKDEGILVNLTLAGGVWFYGDSSTDPFYCSLAQAIKPLGAAQLGHVPRERVPDLVRHHDIVCVLSRSNEPFGLVALEAMASGCAVIASNRGGLPEACGDAAILVDPEDLLAVVAALKNLVTKPALLTQTKRRSLARVASAGWDITARALLAALN
jgi:glycosyltransferase involved in cell wall biosynthesis